MSHQFCRSFFASAKTMAKQQKIAIPSGLTAIRSTPRMFWVEGNTIQGRYVKADCAWDAKAKFIFMLIEQA